MEKKKKKMYLDIAGRRITILSDEDERYVQKLAAVVGQRVNTLMLSGQGVSQTDAALVYALDLLDENFKLRLALEEAKKGKAENDG